MIKNVIFDLGNVLVKCNFELFFSKCYNKKEENIFPLIMPVYEKFNKGEINKKYFLSELKRFLGTSKTLDEIAFDWGNIFTLNSDMTELAKKIKEKRNIFIFSNTDEIHFNRIINDFPQLEIFNGNFMLSYKIGAIKPEAKAYKSALEKYNLSPEESLFIDDRQENIDRAKRFGMTAVHHSDYKSSKDKLTKILNLE